MRLLKALLIITVAALGALMMPAFTIVPTSHVQLVMASYNPAPANFYHAPLSEMGLVGMMNATPDVRTLGTAPSSSDASGPRSIPQNALRFITDNSFFPQSETTIAVDAGNPNHVVGGFNDGKFFLCGFLPADCAGSFSASVSGFTTSDDGGNTVAKSSSLPDLSINGTFLASWGDPSMVAGVDGNFFYASLAINPGTSLLGNGVMIAESNSNLFNQTVSCTTIVSNPTANPCWNARLVYGNLGNFASPVFTFEDKDRIAIDRDPSSQFFGSIYVGWNHFLGDGTSHSYLARCDGNLASCTLIAGGSQPALSGNDRFADWTTPVVDKNGNVYVAWCNFGTFDTFGPVSCRIRSSAPGGASFGVPMNILSYMGAGTTLPNDTVVLGWATEQFRIAAGLISVAADTSPKSNNLYFTVQVCVSGHYYRFSESIASVALDNPGNCGRSSVLFSKSTDNGVSWSSPATLSKPAVNDQPFITVDSATGQVYVVYYTTEFDPFDHSIDVVASISANSGRDFHQLRVTSVSNEPDSDPNMYNYLVPSGLGSSFVVPQYGDYFEATAHRGTLTVLFTANYQVEAGTFQTDPFLEVLHQNNQ